MREFSSQFLDNQPEIECNTCMGHCQPTCKVLYQRSQDAPSNCPQEEFKGKEEVVTWQHQTEASSRHVYIPLASLSLWSLHKP